MQELSPEQLKVMLEDTQASMAAALARIEGFRLREKSLMNELSQLRQQVHGGTPGPSSGGAASPEGEAASGAAAASDYATAGAGPGPEASASRGADGGGAEGAAAAPEAGRAEPWTSPTAAPVYVSRLDGEYPVHVLAGGRKVCGRKEGGVGCGKAVGVRGASLMR